MGILRDGIFGPLRGRTGPLSARVVRKINVVSRLREKGKTSAGEAVSLHRLKFVSVSALLNQLLPLVRLGFAYDKNRGAVQAAMKYNFELIVSDQSGEVLIDYRKVVFSRGRQAGLNSPVVHLEEGSIAVFNWACEEQQEYNRCLDKVCFLVYSASRKEPLIAVGAALRSDLNYSMAIPAYFTGDDLYAYTSVVSFDGRWVSNSMCLGKITI